jgi:hypothetical protein
MVLVVIVVVVVMVIMTTGKKPKAAFLALVMLSFCPTHPN